MLGFFRMVFHHLLSGYYMPGRLSPSSLQTRNSDTYSERKYRNCNTDENKLLQDILEMC